MKTYRVTVEFYRNSWKRPRTFTITAERSWHAIAEAKMELSSEDIEDAKFWEAEVIA